MVIETQKKITVLGIASGFLQTEPSKTVYKVRGLQVMTLRFQFFYIASWFLFMNPVTCLISLLMKASIRIFPA